MNTTLDRTALDVARVAQAVVVLVALVVDFGKYDGAEETLVSVVTFVVIELLKRKNVTPVTDPRGV